MTAPAFQPSDVFFLVVLSGLAILWVLVLVWFTAALVEHPRDAHAQPVGVGEVRSALLALNRAHRPYRLVALTDTELKLDWTVVDASWYEFFGKVKLSMIYRARLLLRERDHEIRCHETLRSGEFFIGFRGLMPTSNWHFRYQSGMLNVVWSGVAYGIKKVFPPQIGQVYHFTLDTVRAKREIEEVAGSKGWSFRGVPCGFEARLGGAVLADRLAAGAQQRGKVRKIGYLAAGISAGENPGGKSFLQKTFLQRLHSSEKRIAHTIYAGGEGRCRM
jgi:hypothetical protein